MSNRYNLYVAFGVPTVPDWYTIDLIFAVPIELPAGVIVPVVTLVNNVFAVSYKLTVVPDLKSKNPANSFTTT